jgi:hypothetical protein
MSGRISRSKYECDCYLSNLARLLTGFNLAQVDAGRSECVYEELKANDRLELWFEVVRGDSLDIKFKLLGPGDKPLLEKESSFNEK